MMIGGIAVIGGAGYHFWHKHVSWGLDAIFEAPGEYLGQHWYAYAIFVGGWVLVYLGGKLKG